MNRTLVEIIVQYALFLERADESEIPLEMAVRQQEDLAFRLQKLSSIEREDFLRILEEIANGMASEEERKVLLRLPEDVGLR